MVLKHWPKDLSHSYALNGDKAIQTTENKILFEAIEDSILVTRSVGSTGVEAMQPVVKKLNVSFIEATSNKSIYPEGSLRVATNRTSMRVWTAQGPVKK